MYVVTIAHTKFKYKTLQKPDILKVFSFACRTEYIGLKRRTFPPFAGRLATLFLLFSFLDAGCTEMNFTWKLFKCSSTASLLHVAILPR